MQNLTDAIEKLFSDKTTDHKCFLHLSFSDGSNPFFYRGTKADMSKEIKKWEKNFTITVVKQDANGIFCEAQENK